MYDAFRYTGNPGGGLGKLSLTVPGWLKSALKRGGKAAISGTMVTVPTPIGNKEFDLSDPEQVKQLKAIMLGVRVSGPGSAGSSMPSIDDMAGVAGPVALGLGAFLLLKMLSRR
jgi:hypothetical protein